ncbi:hypothetical protein [Pseudarthrobacter sp. SORGH_AS 212]|uniref:hypothetical protein n=1 Tax=Pseudarthrobacter sp. SORGH_AS 212 TaxID=3041777 RepID=UPI0032B78DBA
MDPRPNTLGKPSTRREPMVSVARIEAAIKLLYPEDMTPQAKNVLERILEEGN